jgi:glycosyltransferase involved in cell wall biosynthesis
MPIHLAAFRTLESRIKHGHLFVNIGIYQAYWGRVGGGQRYVGVVAERLARHHRVEIVHHCAEFDRAGIAEAMELDLSGVGFRYVPRRERPVWTSANPVRRLRFESRWCRDVSAGYDLFIDSSDNVPFFCHARRGVLLTHFPLVTFEEFHGHTTEAWRARPWPKRLAARLFHRVEWARRFATYALCLVNSEFSQRWLKRLWGLDSAVVYPPLRGSLKPQQKLPVFLTLGAFHQARHKNHEVTLKAFRDLCDGGLTGWRYVLVGACSDSPGDRAYVDCLREQAQGYPIEIRTNVCGGELKDWLERATLLWHSMGFGIDPEEQPGRMEHFGMAATEAMAAGCVPIVFDGGGLRESVSHRETGFLWRTLDELRAFTLAVTRDECLRARLSAAGQRRAQQFSKDRFEARLLETLAPVLS